MSEKTPEFAAVTTDPGAVDVDMLFVPVFAGEDQLLDVPGLDEATDGEFGQARARKEFTGALYQTFMTRLSGGAFKARRVALVGAGQAADMTAERLRRVAAACGYTARLRSVDSVAFAVRSGMDPLKAAETVADGLCAAECDFGSYKRDPQRAGAYPKRVVVVAPGAEAAGLTAAVQRGRTIGDCANLARGLANEPANVLTPSEFAVRVADMCRSTGLSVDVLDEQRIRELKMGLLLGVASGSAEPPRVVVIRHDPPDAAHDGPVLGLVGKGITFDSGGISIKPAEGMDRMKGDMSGGAAVAAAMCAIARLKSPRRVLAVIPMAENAVGGRAMRPGDVVTAADGTRVEVMNTDAEGRLILADALWYAQTLGATHLVDVATLTGACVVALGRIASGLFGTPAAWTDAVQAAAARAGDRLWQLPLYPEHREMLHSETADLMNVAGRWAGSSTAAMFLQEFVKDRPWAHIDIAGTAWAEERKAYQPKGATGVAVRTLTELATMEGL